ncbi:MAG: hypothetical protein LBK52_02810 [Deltaproteobacteria bacterium]|jgi:general secretion pathway protein A|nr:hypothetical protein [Deltaproteobacteria bacterium]
MDYEAFFKLKERPFKNPLETKFFFPVPQLEQLAGILTRTPQNDLVILRGEAGLGKSTLLRHLPRALREKRLVLPILHTGSRLRDILSEALIGFGLGFKCSPQIPEESLLGFFQNAADNFLAGGLGLVLAGDNSQNLTRETAAELLELIKLEPMWPGQLTVLLTARPEASWTAEYAGRAEIMDLVPLNEEQTKNYVLHRMKTAGARKEYFMPETLRCLYRYSGGVPLAVNDLAERSLMAAWAAGKKIVSPARLNQARDSLAQPSPINPEAAGQAAGRRRPRYRVRSWPARLSLAVTMAAVFALGLIFWSKAPREDELRTLSEARASAAQTPAAARPAAPAATATPAAEPALPGQAPGLGLPAPPPVLLSLPHNAMVLAVDQSSGQARLWQGQLKKTGLKAELAAPALPDPGLYLLGRPKSRIALFFQYPPGKEVPRDIGDKIWPQVETVLPQDILPVIAADSQLLHRPADTRDLAVLQEKLKAWTSSQEVKFTDNLAVLYADPFVYYEPGRKPQTISRENFQVALASEARTSGDVKLAISEPVIMLDPRSHSRAWAVFSLRYDSRLRHDLGLRTLIFEKNLLGNDWLIKAELWIRENSLEG